MTNPTILEMNPGLTRQQELEQFLSDMEAELLALTSQIGEPEQSSDGTALESDVQKAVAIKVQVRSQPTFEQTWSQLRDLQTLEVRIKETFAAVCKQSDALHSKIVAWRDHYAKRVTAVKSDRKQAVSKYYHHCHDKWLERQRALEDSATAAPGEALEAVVAPATIEKQPGGSISKKYEANVDDLMKLVKAVASGDAPIEAIKADASVLNKLASAQKDNFSLPGVSPVWKAQVRVNAWR